jgi:hypothetical protein
VIPDEWRDLAEFQLHIAKRWRDRGARTEDLFAQFFFYFAGVNALYYLWSRVDDVRGRTPDRAPNEGRQIENLLSKAAPSDSADVLAKARQCAEYFAVRRPIERMGKRSQRRATVGDVAEGRKALDVLRSGNDTERLHALGRILYLVRSNLAHGSKMDQGDDQDVIKHSVPGLGAILNWAIGHTSSELGRA